MSLTEVVARNVGIDVDDVAVVLDEFLLQLHRHAFEYKGLNGDYLGEELHYDVGRQAFFHLLRFLDWFSENYSWDQSSPEYLRRLGRPAEWMPFVHQAEGWAPGRLARGTPEGGQGDEPI